MKKVDATMFGKNCNDPIKKLENSVLRGEKASLAQPARDRKPRRQKSTVSSNYRNQHKANERGQMIVMLPRNPYGHHKTYEDHSNFSRTHFITSEYKTSS